MLTKLAVRVLLGVAVCGVSTSFATGDLQLMARQGANGLTNFGSTCSINDFGQIAFTANDSLGSRAFVVAHPMQPAFVSGIVGSNRTYAGIGINSSTLPVVVARELVSGPFYIVRTWPYPTGNSAIVGASTSADFDSATSLVDINDSGIVAGVGVKNSSPVIFAGTVRPPTVLATFPGGTAPRVHISNDNFVVTRDNLGRILAFKYPSGTGISAAGLSDGFGASTGNRPGISATGQAIAFTGDRGNGPGVFVSFVARGGTRQLISIVGDGRSDGFTSFPSESRIGINSIIAPNTLAQDIQIVFQGFRNGKFGLYSAGLIDTPGNAAVISPQLIAETGGFIPGSQSVSYTGFNLYDPINKLGDIAFWASLSDGSSAIFRLNSSGPRVLFRNGNHRTWGISTDVIPGWDHVALFTGSDLYESTPGYPAGDYWDPLRQIPIPISNINGVQKGHTVGSFQWDSTAQSGSTATFDAIQLMPGDAMAMRAFCETKLGAGYLVNIRPSLDFIAEVASLFSSRAQKGYTGNSYTCCGLVERAAEEIGINDGEGFVPNRLEEVRLWLPRLGFVNVPLLTPQHLYRAMKDPSATSNKRRFLAGLFDPIDFILTDPLGRRLGYTQALGKLNEIPNSDYDGDGTFEQFLVYDPLPGQYTITLYGTGNVASGAAGGLGTDMEFREAIPVGETRTFNVAVTQVAYPTSVSTITGSEFLGDLASVLSDDESRYSVFPDEANLAATVEALGTLPSPAPSSFAVEFETRAARLGIAETYFARNYLSNTWSVIGGKTSLSSDQRTITANLPTPTYMGSGREVGFRVRWAPINDEDPSVDGWLLDLDYIRWNFN